MIAEATTIETKAKKILEIISKELRVGMCEVRHKPESKGRFEVTVVASQYSIFSSYFLDRAAKRIGKEVDPSVYNIVVSVTPEKGVEFCVYLD